MHKEKLEDVAEITMGTSPSGDTYNEDGNGLPLLNGPTEFGQMSPNCTLFTTDSKRECESGDLIFCVRGSTTGRMNWADQVYSLGRGVCSIRGNSELETKYVKYALDFSLKSLLKLAGGGTFPNLTKTTIHNFEIPYPENRFEIASILSAFDDLISTNTRRIEILEEMARRIYREWFVHFRYPGHEDDELVDSGTELGEIPEGWEVKEFGELVEYERDRVKDDDIEEKVSVLGLGDMPKKSITLSEWENTDDIGSTKLRFKKDDILFGKIRPYFHKVGFAQTFGVCSSDIFVWRPKEPKDFVLSLLVASSDKFVETATNSSSGTKMPRAKWDVLEKYTIVYPPDNLLEKLNSSVGSSLKQIRTLSFQNKRLKETRNLLLPKLISGKIDVEEITFN